MKIHKNSDPYPFGTHTFGFVRKWFLAGVFHGACLVGALWLLVDVIHG